MKTLVTGHAGYIGSVLAEQLSSNGHDVTGFDLAKNSKDDVRDRSRIQSVFAENDFDVVYHLAAEADVWADDWQYLLETNVMGSVNITAAAREADVRVIFGSSVAASGDFNRYGRSKNIAEQAVSEYENVTTVRFPNVAGLHAPRGQAHDMIQEALSGEIEVWENGEIRRSYVDVRDLCSSLREIGKAPYVIESLASIFAHNTTNLELAELVQIVVEEETDISPDISLIDRSPPSPKTLIAGDFRISNPIPLKESVRSQVNEILDE